MKQCTKCEEKKPDEEFSWRLGKRRSRCKRCELEAQKARYKADPSKQLEVVNNIRKRNRQFIWNYYSQNPCVDCGENDPIVLELDHVRGEKKAGVSQLVHNTRSLAVIKTEIAKCDVVCANCHRRRTAKTQEWYTGMDALLIDKS